VMSTEIDALKTGDNIRISYRTWDSLSGPHSKFIERWVAAEIFHCEPGWWPLARLSDGQVTEIRPFMTWRRMTENISTHSLAA